MSTRPSTGRRPRHDGEETDVFDHRQVIGRGRGRAKRAKRRANKRTRYAARNATRQSNR